MTWPCAAPAARAKVVLPAPGVATARGNHGCRSRRWLQRGTLPRTEPNRARHSANQRIWPRPPHPCGPLSFVDEMVDVMWVSIRVRARRRLWSRRQVRRRCFDRSRWGPECRCPQRGRKCPAWTTPNARVSSTEPAMNGPDGMHGWRRPERCGTRGGSARAPSSSDCVLRGVTPVRRSETPHLGGATNSSQPTRVQVSHCRSRRETLAPLASN